MEQQKKSLKPWIVLLILPIPLLFFVAIVQMVARFITNGSGGAVFLIVNIFSLLIGIASVILLMGIPIWIVFLVLAYEHNSKLNQQ